MLKGRMTQCLGGKPRRQFRMKGTRKARGQQRTEQTRMAELEPSISHGYGPTTYCRRDADNEETNRGYDERP